ncbi:unnamed protein product, partial [Musa acuminata subsp. burmannicoides]
SQQVFIVLLEDTTGAASIITGRSHSYSSHGRRRHQSRRDGVQTTMRAHVVSPEHYSYWSGQSICSIA